MDDEVRQWLLDPLVGKFAAAAVALAVLYAGVRFLERSISRSVTEVDTSYRTGKFVALIGYVAGLAALASIFSDRLGGDRQGGQPLADRVVEDELVPLSRAPSFLLCLGQCP